MIAPSSPSSFALSSSSINPMGLLVRQIEEAQRLERLLWSDVREGGTDKLAIAGTADVAWMQVRISADACISVSPVGWLGREKRLAAALLQSILDASETEQVERQQEMARVISNDERVGTRDEVQHLLHMIGHGPFVLSPVNLRLPIHGHHEDEAITPGLAA